MNPASYLIVVALLTSGSLSPHPGQDPATRAEALRQQRQARQQTVRPHEPDALERVMHLAEERVVPVLQRDGIYAKFGSLTTASGTAYGAGYRDRALVDGLGSLDLWAARSLRGYWAFDARVQYPLAPGNALAVGAHARRYDYPQEEFFGVGPASDREEEATYRHRGALVGATLLAAPVRHLTVGGGVEFFAPRIRRGGDVDDDEPSIFEQFPTAPGLGPREGPDYLRSSAFVTWDYRQPKNARRGGFYRVDVSRYADRASGALSFTQTTVDLRQYVSILAERRVFVGRVWLATTDADAGAAVPFYLMPALGGHDTLRGYHPLRFRGPHALLLQGEYRWEIWSGFEGALFYDAGKVATRRADLDLRDLERDYGFGFRFNTDEGVIMRIDAAFGGREGRRLHVVFGGFF